MYLLFAHDKLSVLPGAAQPQKPKGTRFICVFIVCTLVILLCISPNLVIKLIQRVPALRVFWDLEKTVLHETRVSGTVLWSPTNANSPTYTYISQKTC